LRGVITTECGRLAFALSPAGEEPIGRHWLLELPVERQQALARFLGHDVLLGLRPEHVRLRSGLAGSTTSAMTAVVERAEVAVPGMCLRLRAGAHALTARAPDTFKVEPNETVRVDLDTCWAQFFDPNSGQALVEGCRP